MERYLGRQTILLAFKKRWIPPGSLRERYWIELVQIFRLFLRDGLRGVVRYLKLFFTSGRPMVPAWWYTSVRDQQNILEWEKFVFLQQDRKPAGDIVIIFAGVPFQETNPQRSLWIAKEFIRNGFLVLFAYWRWRPSEVYPQPDRLDSLYLMPIDVLWAHAGRILTDGRFAEACKILMIDFPHPSLFKVINIANGAGWTTVVTQVDDWEAFQRVGQASWYDAEFEAYLLENADVLIGTARSLVEKMEAKAGREVHYVPNAYDPESLRLGQEQKPLKRGVVTLGYFGHLTPAWFDWELVKGLAERRPDWEVYLIGGGGEWEGMPGNVHLLGRVAHEELAGYACNWDVGLIPFKEGELSRGVDPLKVYEYLAMRLPVVASGLPQLEGMPGVKVVQGEAGYEAAIEAVLREGVDWAAVERYLQEHTWAKRVEKILELVEAAKKIPSLER